jgi:starch phosphorylase
MLREHPGAAAERTPALIRRSHTQQGEEQTVPGAIYSVEVQPILPQRLARLTDLANDLYFSWDRGVRRLFRDLDEACWEGCAHNPKVFLRRVPQARLDTAAEDPLFLAEYRRTLTAYDTYLEATAHSPVEPHLDPARDRVAYFSAEFGFHQSMPIYAGGLGILAADYCKAMSHLRAPFVGVGMLYRQGYFAQRLLCDGEQVADHRVVEPSDLPVTPALDASGNEVRVSVELAGRRVQLRVWVARAGHVRLFLLDSDTPENGPDERRVTYQLYGGDAGTRIQQEIVLGIGGVRALRALGIAPTVWHINEGHAAFLVVERCRERVREGYDFASALEGVAADTVFTTHTPVPAGHDSFEHGLMRSYFGGMMGELGIDEARFLALGASPHTPGAFNMTSLALRGSRMHNGVSRIHGQVASQMESHIWPQVPPAENPIGYVTNGVDVGTFHGLPWNALFDMYLDRGWRARLTDEAFWARFIDHIPNHVFQSVHEILKSELLGYARQLATTQFRRGGYAESLIQHLTRYLDVHHLDTLLVGFARRFATYKRATLLFRDLPRLARLVNDPDRPVLFLFAGKAHPRDLPGQQLIREIAAISMRPEFQGRILLLEDYNFSMARRLMPGVDVWLNVPEYPKEACGTSGMKAAINGAINLSVLDGWWGEGYDGENGWAITPHPELEPQRRDEQEAMELLDILEHQVVPLYYARGRAGDRDVWINKAKASMKTVLPRFNSVRMALDYLRDYYAPASRHGPRLGADSGAGARALAAWKAQVHEAWPRLRVRLAGPIPDAVRADAPLPLDVAVYLNGLRPEHVQAECLLGRPNELGEFVVSRSVLLSPAGQTGEGETLYRVDLRPPGGDAPIAAGLGQFKIRVYPYHPLLRHRFETGRMLWLE